MEYFTISFEHYLAFANVENRTTYILNSVIYLWNGTLFVALKTLQRKAEPALLFLQ